MGREKGTGATSQGKQHFSHPHNLKLVNPTESETLSCNACEKPNNNNKPNFYGCNSCQYFLHENYLNAPRFLDHSSHPSHPLNLFPIPTYSSRSYTCKACGSNGNGFCFSCACCEFDIHLQCASCPSSILVDKHPHQLELLFGSPYDDKDITYVCDICNVIMNRDSWLYYCAGCDFASHLQCASTPEVGVFPIQQRSNPNRYRNTIPNPNATVEMINSVNDAHERLMAAQLESQIAARSRQAILDSIDGPSRRYSYY
ncbi:protein VACUOLELESS GAMETOPHYTES-like [Nicotiana tabacum]